MNLNSRLLVAVITSSLVLSGCGKKESAENAGNQESLKGEIRIDGSSTVYPITEAVAEEFRGEQPEVKVTVGVSGTGGGFKKFTRGEIDIKMHHVQ